MAGVLNGVKAEFQHARPNANLMPGAHLLFNVLNCETETLRNMTAGLLRAATTTRVPVLLGWGAQVWWDQRTGVHRSK